MNKISIMQASVRKWQRIIDGKGSDGGVLDCPPCRLFYMLVCVGCPIAAYSGKKFCKNTPYIPWYRHQMEAHGCMFRKVYCPQCRELAIDMRDYMQAIVKHLTDKRDKKARAATRRAKLAGTQANPDERR
jgi:hypothetical protein